MVIAQLGPTAIALLVLGGLVVCVALYDISQRRHAILRNFPILGHFRYLFEAVGPELRQYIVTNNDEELPFSRDQRRWIYASSKKQNNYFGFGSDNGMETQNHYLIIKHSSFPIDSPHPGDRNYDPEYRVPQGKVLGAHRGRRHALRSPSVVNISAMSFGSLSGPAIRALNEGAKIAGCWHNTGEGGISPHHQHGGELIWQLGTGYFGARDEDGGFSLDRFLEAVDQHPVRAVEIKLSQGAKPGLGGILPAAKITPEIAAIRGIPLGQDCLSPSSHRAFRNADELLDFVEKLGDASGLPIGIKSAVGQLDFFEDLASRMESGSRGIDFLTIDGGEGGTGAGPLVFTDHVALPFKNAFSRVYRIFAERGLHEQVVFFGSGRLGLPESALLAFSLGCDGINIAREAMLAVGCIQAQRCHTGHCPTGVATQNRWLTRGLDPTHKSVRLANYVITLRKEILSLCRACGVSHPALITPEQLEVLDGELGSRTVRETFGYEPGWGTVSAEDRDAVSESRDSRAS